jgi:phage terminase Nu1 subunit (DNA packaging protein)
VAEEENNDVDNSDSRRRWHLSQAAKDSDKLDNKDHTGKSGNEIGHGYSLNFKGTYIYC